VQQFAATSPGLRARIAGFFYLLTFVFGGVAQAYVGKRSAVGDAAGLIATISYVVVVLMFYELFRAVSARLSLLAAVFGMLGCTWGAFNSIHLVPFRINSLVFFGFYCLLIGYLIWKSTFLPRALGLLMAVAGAGWLTFISNDLAHGLAPYNLIPGILGEGCLTLWLLAMGVDSERWRARVSLVWAITKSEQF